jgi:hypothetical protein
VAAERIAPAEAMQNFLGPEPVREQSPSELQPTGLHVPPGPHTVPLKGWPGRSPEGLQSRSTAHGIPHFPPLHLARAIPSCEKHCASLVHEAGTHTLRVVSHV